MAAAYRDALRTVEDVSERQLVQSLKGENVDVFGFFEAGGTSRSASSSCAGGVVQDRREFFFEKSEEVEPGRVPRGVSPAVLRRQPVPARADPPSRRRSRSPSSSRSSCSARRGARVKVRVPRRGAGRGARGARQHQRAAAAPRSGSAAPAGPQALGVERLARVLDLPSPPRRIEAFDISHLQGTDSVASLVVFEDGKPKKSDYRLFGIASQSLLAPDDFRSMAEAVERRYRRLRDEGAALPDLVLVDGGRGQLQAALTALDRLGVALPAAGLAKREEEIWVPGPARSPSASPARTRP